MQGLTFFAATFFAATFFADTFLQPPGGHGWLAFFAALVACLLSRADLFDGMHLAQVFFFTTMC